MRKAFAEPARRYHARLISAWRGTAPSPAQPTPTAPVTDSALANSACRNDRWGPPVKPPPPAKSANAWMASAAKTTATACAKRATSRGVRARAPPFPPGKIRQTIVPEIRPTLACVMERVMGRAPAAATKRGRNVCRAPAWAALNFPRGSVTAGEIAPPVRREAARRGRAWLARATWGVRPTATAKLAFPVKPANAS